MRPTRLPYFLHKNHSSTTSSTRVFIYFLKFLLCDDEEQIVLLKGPRQTIIILWCNCRSNVFQSNRNALNLVELQRGQNTVFSWDRLFKIATLILVFTRDFLYFMPYAPSSRHVDTVIFFLSIIIGDSRARVCKSPLGFGRVRKRLLWIMITQG